jgi:hypothetical protein
MPPPDAFSHDQAVKNLIKDYPIEALEFLAPDVLAARGVPLSVAFLDPAVAKDDSNEPGPGQAMDLAIRFEFADGPGVILILVEHWSDASKLDLLRTARYYLDLCRRFPAHEVLSIALVDDDRPHDLRDTVEQGALGVVHFRFFTRIVQIPSLRLEQFRDTVNRVALSFSPNMAGVSDSLEQVIQVAIAFRDLGDLAGLRKFFAFWVVEGRLHEQDQSRVLRRFKELEMPIIMEWLRQEGIEIGLERGVKQGLEQGLDQGIRQKALEDARRMLGHGISWAIITDVTGIRPEDLQT